MTEPEPEILQIAELLTSLIEKRMSASMTPAPTVEDRLLRVGEVASLTGEKPWAVYQLHRKGILPALVNGRSKRWRESTVRAYIETAPKL